jgi:hypothetical protein
VSGGISAFQASFGILARRTHQQARHTKLLISHFCILPDNSPMA